MKFNVQILTNMTQFIVGASLGAEQRLFFIRLFTVVNPTHAEPINAAAAAAFYHSFWRRWKNSSSLLRLANLRIQSQTHIVSSYSKNHMNIEYDDHIEASYKFNLDSFWHLQWTLLCRRKQYTTQQEIFKMVLSMHVAHETKFNTLNLVFLGVYEFLAEPVGLVANWIVKLTLWVTIGNKNRLRKLNCNSHHWNHKENDLSHRIFTHTKQGLRLPILTHVRVGLCLYSYHACLRRNHLATKLTGRCLLPYNLSQY